MKILIVGSGGREHALGYKIKAQNPEHEVIFAPGNAGTEDLGKNIDISASDIEQLTAFAVDEKIDFVIIGPEVPLCLGLADGLEAKGMGVFGVSKAAAKLEGSKSYAKEFMIRNNLPTAEYKKFSKVDLAIEYGKELLKKSRVNKVVVKADGLCAGKGVLICENESDLKKAVEDILQDKVFGENELIVEEFLDGFEISMHCLIDCDSYLMLPDVKDHKRIFEGERGLNTGGMGTYSPNLQATVYAKEILNSVIKPFHAGLKAENIDFRGMIFLGLMVTESGVKVLEFNCRFGDPETQSLMLRIDSNLLDALIKVSKNELKSYKAEFNKKAVITTVMASGGYPQSYEKGYEIKGIEADEKTVIFHAGTKKQGEKIVTNGGRVLAISSAADSFEEAYKNVYDKISKIEFQNKFYRKDISPLVKRVYIAKQDKYDILSKDLSEKLSQFLNKDIKAKIYQRYDIEGLDEIEIKDSIYKILANKATDTAFAHEAALQLQKEIKNPLIISSKPGQFNIREYNIMELLKLRYLKEDIAVKCEKVIELDSQLNNEELKKIEEFLINPVIERRGKLLDIPTSIFDKEKPITKCQIIEGFKDLEESELKEFLAQLNLAMNLDDLKTIRDYFKSEDRNPTLTEIRILDTYWSDHCRHTTFNTILEEIDFEKSDRPLDKTILKTFESYLENHDKYRKDRPITLMDLATINQKIARENGDLDDIDISEEINACSVNIKADVDGEDVDYLLMFKNETHNHPTEIEPFGGAATCLGGAIRDPLSGRSYVYQAMRITGAADVLEPIEKTLPGKLPQNRITTEASDGYSSYGNQIGLTTGYLDEIYHPGFKAKRMELGAVIAAAPKENVIREQPKNGDIILLVGARTGRDGVGGATGSSKVHTEDSADESSAEVQKGNAPIERNIQRLFRRKEVATLIKRCNDFGAGGVSVAIGELADSLEINLEKVPLKYSGIKPGDIAISESQERMAVVIAKESEEEFKKYCALENVEVTTVAKVTDSGRMTIKYRDEIIADLSREFLNSAGAKRYQNIIVESDNYEAKLNSDFEIEKELKANLSSLNGCSKKNLIEKFDSTIGARTVIMPLGGKNQIAPSQGMAARIPISGLKTNTVSLMTYGYNPYLFEESTFLGGYYAVCESLTKLAAMGADVEKARLTFQEYFKKLETDERKWALSLKALLGAYKLCDFMKTPPIGGKDSMSGTFEDINVPSTLVSFAVGVVNDSEIITSELKGDKKIGLLLTKKLEDNTLDENELLENFRILKKEMLSGNVKTAIALNRKGLLPLLTESAFGNDYGYEIRIDKELMFSDLTGGFIVEYEKDFANIKKIGKSIKQNQFKVNGENLDYEELKTSYLTALDTVFSPEVLNSYKDIEINKHNNTKSKSNRPTDKVKVIIPIVPGDNCEEELAKAFERAGAETEIYVFKTLTKEMIIQSTKELAEKISNAQILAIAGGFTIGDEPDSTGLMMAEVLKKPEIKKSVQKLLDENDGLILGVNSGFESLLKTGLLPYGEYREFEKTNPSLSFNESKRHIAKILKTKIVSKNSAWLSDLELGRSYNVPASSTEGRFVADDEMISKLISNNQIVSIFEENPFGSMANIEAIISPDGKILGKICHTERLRRGLYKNIPHITSQNIFRAAVDYFKK